MVEAALQRIVPGAPPPTPLSKSQRKKRKNKVKPTEPSGDTPASPVSAAIVEKAPDTSGVMDGAVAAARSEPTVPQLPDEEPLLKPSPIVDLIHKRLKATSKKISRISIYASTDPEKLNDDQKRTLKTLPILEAVQKELGEVKKAIEMHESELVQELALRRIEAEKAEKARVADAVAAAQRISTAKTSDLLNFLRLRSLLASGDLGTSAFDLNQAEIAVVFSVAEILVGEDGESKQTVLNGFLSGDGEFEGTTFSRLLEITHHGLNPPRVPTPIGDEQIEELQDPSTSLSTINTEPEVAVTGVANTIPTSGSFHFMQASELETPSFEDSAEWVNRTDVVDHQAEEAGLGQPDIAEAAEEVAHGNGDLQASVTTDFPTEGEVTATIPGSESIDWAADDEGGLPSIDGLHAKFGTSGSATPVGEETQQSATPVNGHTNEVPSQYEEDDGFTQARGGRGRGRGTRGGDRDRRGSFRGGDRGFRGGHDRGFRGGSRGDRGGDRGGSGFRGRGEWRGDGESRGRGGRGRGRSDRGGPHTPTNV